MTLSIFCLVLFAALMHASWNAIVKGAPDKLMTTVLVSGFAALISAIALPFLPAPAPAAWPFLLISPLLQALYFALVARCYHVSDMSQAYPLMRGAAPLLVAVAGVLFLGEHLGWIAWAGIGVVCLGVLAMTLGSGRLHHVALPLFNAVVIASYTLLDAAGARRAGNALSYTLWLFLLTALPLLAWAVLAQRARFVAQLRQHAQRGLAGGIGTLLSYSLALWAMTQATVALVAALRESAILYGLAISALVLKERPPRRRLIAASIIALGVVVLRLA
ncbi:EamA family transporter [Pseudoxanthomonas sp.]|uniref:EamA family transporter n=1 Tax=Pseudoxanthomonas sp. TaxID=1871049 RepID=UPI00260CF89B|nr:EamA family transporter [Pseudoxanthomonas sp.]WDS35662.1 MAG: EamA family transporter [Pseudoxanthomonas sp.]